MGYSLKTEKFFLESRLADAAGGDVEACYDLGVAFSCGTGGVGIDRVAAHKWFNLAALAGDRRGQECRSEVAEEMSAREIAEAQRQARAWLTTANRRAA